MLKNSIKFTACLALIIGFSVSFAGAYDDFFKAITFDDTRTIDKLLGQGFDANSLDEKGQGALYLSLREGSFKTTDLLLRQPSVRIDQVNAAGETALMMAALKGHTEWVQRLVDQGARLESPTPLGWTALHYAASGTEPRVVALLLARGARIDALSPNGSTPLMMAARYGHEDSVHLLLKQGADQRLRNDQHLDAADFARLGGREKLAAFLATAAR